jgi:predicted phosphodiesterase
MKIALFSDVHANLPALEAFFNDVSRRSADAVYCLGDLVGYNVWPNEVVNEIRKRGIPTIACNYDFGIGKAIDDCGCAYKNETDKTNGAVSISFTNEIIGEEERKYLRSLPSHFRLEFQLNDSKLKLLLVHGSPRRINEYLFEDRDEKSFQRIMEDADADIMCFGHTHIPYHKILNTGSDEHPYHRHAINTGSVGKPKDGNPMGGYLLLTIDENTSVIVKDSPGLEFVRFKYDTEKAAKAIEESLLPDIYAESLRKGI